MNTVIKKRAKALSLCGIAALTCCLICSCGSTVKYEDDLSGYVTLGEYKGVTVSAAEIDEQLESAVTTLITNNTTTGDITDRALASGDTAKVKYTLKSGDEELETKEDYSVVLGTATDLFAESLIGKSVNDSYSIDVMLPDDYTNADYAGKNATYDITVSSATEKIVPELSDDFIAEKTDYSTYDQYEAATRLDIRKSMIWDQIIENCTFSSYPTKNIEIYYNRGVDYYNNMFAYYSSLSGSSSGSTDIYSQFGTTKEKVYEQAADQALQQVKQDLVSLSIAKAEGISATDEEIDTYATEHFSELGYSDEQALIKGMGKDSLERTVILEHVIDLVNESAVEN